MPVLTSTKTASRSPTRSWADIAAGRLDCTDPEPQNIQQPVPTESTALIVVTAEEPKIDTSDCRGSECLVVETHADTYAYPLGGDTLTKEGGNGVLAVEPTSQATALQLHPATRGSWQCFCHGEVVMMRGNYGWLAVYGDIDHPDAAKHEGHIYVHKRDVVVGEDLVEGDPVSFYLYADGQGLGAEYCCREITYEHDPEFADNQSFMHCPHSQLGLRAEALEFQPLCGFQAAVEAPWFEGAEACAFPPALAFNSQCAEASLQATTPVPGFSAMNPDAAAFAPSTHCVESYCAQSGSEADDEDESAWSDVVSSSFTDDESDVFSASDAEEVAVWDEELEAVVMTAPLRFKTTSSENCTFADTIGYSSTCDGETSDSGWDCDAPVKTSSGWVRPPPGLSLLA